MWTSACTIVVTARSGEAICMTAVETVLQAAEMMPPMQMRVMIPTECQALLLGCTSTRKEPEVQIGAAESRPTIAEESPPAACIVRQSGAQKPHDAFTI